VALVSALGPGKKELYFACFLIAFLAPIPKSKQKEGNTTKAELRKVNDWSLIQ
jgi:hypothetical protein